MMKNRINQIIKFLSLLLLISYTNCLFAETDEFEIILKSEINSIENKLSQTSENIKHEETEILKNRKVNILVALKAYSKFKRNDQNRAVINSFHQFYKNIKSINSQSNTIKHDQPLYFFQAIINESNLKIGFSDICESIDEGLHLLLIGQTRYRSCEKLSHIDSMTFGPGLEFYTQGGLGIACALSNEKDKSINVGIKASATAAIIGGQVGLAVGENGICVYAAHTAAGLGASVGIETLIIFQ